MSKISPAVFGTIIVALLLIIVGVCLKMRASAPTSTALSQPGPVPPMNTGPMPPIPKRPGS